MAKQKEQKDEVYSEGKKAARFIRHHYFILSVVILAVAMLVSFLIYFDVNSSRVYIDQAEISAPIISLNPSSPGILDRVLVKVGDIVSPNVVVAQIDGASPVKTKTSGVITMVQNTPGSFVTTQIPVVQMVDPTQLKVIGRIEEDKGLSSVKVGQPALFTVDAFGSRQYYGTVDAVSPTSRSSDIVFSISDKRQEQNFDVYVKFDVNKYPELKNGMSARIWVYI